MSAASILADATEAQGWDLDSQVAVLLDYVANQDDDATFADYVANRVANENLADEELAMLRSRAPEQVIDLPAGYRWATEEETLNPPSTAVVVRRTADSSGRPYAEDESDVAVPL